MRIASTLLLGAGIASAPLTLPGPASAYVVQDPTWAYMPNAMGEPWTVCATGMPPEASLRTKEAAALWNYEHFAFSFAPDITPAQCAGVTATRFSPVFDGVNQISFGNGLSRNVLAITTRWYEVGSVDTLECDMHFDRDYNWYTGVEPTVPFDHVDWLGVAAHEMGHCVGLDHEDDPNISPEPVMRSAQPQTGRRLPTNNDLAGRNAIYGIPAAGVDPAIQVEPGSASYGNVVIGRFLDRIVTVRNAGTADLAVTSATIGGADAGEFLIVSGVTGPFALQPDQGRDIVVAFQPSGVGGARSATLELSSDDPTAEVVQVALTGTAVDAIRDMAVTQIMAPKRVISGRREQVTVEIQNRGAVPVSFTDADLARGFVTLAVTSVDAGDESCGASATVALDTRKNGALFKGGPKVLAPKRKADVAFQVTYTCAAAQKTATGPDYKHVARVFQSVLVGTDSHPADDVCPHAAVHGGVDPNPDGSIRDKGCGASLGRGFFGGDVTTEVVAR